MKRFNPLCRALLRFCAEIIVISGSNTFALPFCVFCGDISANSICLPCWYDSGSCPAVISSVTDSHRILFGRMTSTCLFFLARSVGRRLEHLCRENNLAVAAVWRAISSVPTNEVTPWPYLSLRGSVRLKFFEVGMTLSIRYLDSGGDEVRHGIASIPW